MSNLADDVIPDYWASRFEEIDFSHVLSEGRKHLCLDLDNTLLPQKGQQIERSVLSCLDRLRESGQVQKVSLVSNVMLPGHRVSRLFRLAKILSIDYVVPCYFWSRKPFQAPFRKALELMDARPEETVMVGDQIFSDIVGGNRMGLFTVWLDPISEDHWSTLITGRRKREAAIKRALIELKVRGLVPIAAGLEQPIVDPVPDSLSDPPADPTAEPGGEMSSVGPRTGN